MSQARGLDTAPDRQNVHPEGTSAGPGSYRVSALVP